MNIQTVLSELTLSWIAQNIQVELADASRFNRTHEQFLQRLLAGESEHRHAKAVERRLREARISVAKSLESFDWAWPKKINRDQIRHLFTLRFIQEKSNVIFVGTTGLGKTHLAAALAAEACRHKHRVVFTSAADLVNTLAAAVPTSSLGRTIRRYLVPDLLVVDELGYLPIDRTGADLLFQVIGGRYEKGATIITTNRAFKDWPKTFACDSTLTSAVLDRTLHHCEAVVIEGTSYRMKDRIENPCTP
jgi:DNA replication protein DnaC